MLSVVVMLIVIGVLLWWVTTYVPMEGTIKNLLIGFVVLCCILWILGLLGVLPVDLPVPRLAR